MLAMKPGKPSHTLDLKIIPKGKRCIKALNLLVWFESHAASQPRTPRRSPDSARSQQGCGCSGAEQEQLHYSYVGVIARGKAAPRVWSCQDLKCCVA